MAVKRQRPLTPGQKKVLDFIREFAEKNGYSPSLSEIAKFLKKSTSTAQHYVEELQNRSYLHKEENIARGISPIPEASAHIFLLGYIAAGEPIEPLENPEPISVPLSMINNPGQYYALKVKGNSMVDDGIWDEDIVIIKHQLTAGSGETVVAITEKGATLKIFRKKNGRIFLEPRNRNLPNIYPKELEIRGKFCGLIRG
jgi:repressor LexA